MKVQRVKQPPMKIKWKPEAIENLVAFTLTFLSIGILTYGFMWELTA